MIYRATFLVGVASRGMEGEDLLLGRGRSPWSFVGEVDGNKRAENTTIVKNSGAMLKTGISLAVL